MKEGEFVWLVVDSVKRCEYKLGKILDIFTGNDGVVRSARVKMAHGELKPPVVKSAPVFYEGVPETQNRARDGKLKKLSIRQNPKMVKIEMFYKLAPKICTPRIFGRENLRNPRL